MSWGTVVAIAFMVLLLTAIVNYFVNKIDDDDESEDY